MTLAAFTDSDIDQLDYRLLQGGAVKLFYRKEILLEAGQGLQALGYQLIRLVYRDEPTFYGEMSDALEWERNFGYSPWNGNLNALADGFREFPFGDKGKAALCIEDFDKLAQDDNDLAAVLLDILESESRNHLLFGNRLIGLIQTSDAKYDPGLLGGRSAQWNAREWLNAARGL